MTKKYKQVLSILMLTQFKVFLTFQTRSLTLDLHHQIKTTRKNRVFYYNPSIATNTTPCKQYLKSIITPNLNFSVLISHCFAVSLFRNRYAISTWRHLASAIRRFLTASQFRYFSIATRFSTFVTPSSEASINQDCFSASNNQSRLLRVKVDGLKKQPVKTEFFYYNPSIATNTPPCKQYMRSIISHCYAVSLFRNRYAISTFSLDGVCHAI